MMRVNSYSTVVLQSEPLMHNQTRFTVGFPFSIYDTPKSFLCFVIISQTTLSHHAQHGGVHW